MNPPTVFLVGAGPGDPGLLTVRAASLLARADIVLHDALVDERILALAKPAARLISVGKRAGGSRTEQSEINNLLVHHGRTGHTVVRLKGGDPYLFGRGGEEALALVEATIPFEVVPGVTAAVAAGAYSGIPLTHRGLSSACIFVTGHEDPTKPESDINWPAIARSKSTLCIYMGLAQLDTIANTLIKEGRPPEEPAALISSATLPEQRTILSTLAEVAHAATRAGLEPPAVLIVGPVASLRNQLDWFEKRPLFGKTVLVTRPADQSASLTDRLTAFGARPIVFPTIETQSAPDLTMLDNALSVLSDFEWVIFSSANAVRVFFDRLAAVNLDSRAFGRCRVAAIGPATASALAQHEIRHDLIPEEYVAESLLQALTSQGGLKGKRILHPRSNIARDVLAKALLSSGALLSDLVVYHTVPARHSPEAIRKLIESRPNFLTFTSASTATNFVSILGESNARALAASATVVSIGPVTSDALRRLGLPVHVEAPRHTTDGLVDALLEHGK